MWKNGSKNGILRQKERASFPSKLNYILQKKKNKTHTYFHDYNEGRRVLTMMCHMRVGHIRLRKYLKIIDTMEDKIFMKKCKEFYWDFYF